MARPQGYSEIRTFPDEMDQVQTVDSLRGRSKHIPSVTCIYGRRGQGKTLLASTMAHQLKSRFRRAGIPFRLYSNFWMDGSDRAYQGIVEELQTFPRWLDEAPFSLLVIDEVAELLPSLRAMSSDNLLTMGFLKQIRKRGVSVVMATQYPQEITMGILRQCDWFILSQAVEGGRHLKTYWWDWPGNITGNWGRKYFPPERDTHDFAVGYSNTYKMWGSYRTDEIVAPRFSNRREEIRKEQTERRLGRLDGAPNPDELKAGDGMPRPGGKWPPAIAAVIEETAGSGVGVVTIEDLVEPLRALWNTKASSGAIAQRLRILNPRAYVDDGDEPYILYDPPDRPPEG